MCNVCTEKKSLRLTVKFITFCMMCSKNMYVSFGVAP